jgi:hypothetical protein
MKGIAKAGLPLRGCLNRRRKSKLFVVLCISALFGTGFGRQYAHAVTVEEMNRMLSGLADDFLFELPMLSAAGLGWSDPYIGQLLGYPNHFGFGLTMAAPLLPGKLFKSIGESVFLSPVSDTYEDKLLFPVYTLETRVGGFAGIPFDLGFKFGFIPIVPLFGDLGYYSSHYGFDIRYRIIHLPGGGEVSVGLGYNRFEAEISGDYVFTIKTGIVSNGGTVTFGWTSDTYNFKICAFQPFVGTPFGMFANVDIGYEVLNTFWILTAKPNGMLMGDPAIGDAHGGKVDYVIDDHYKIDMDRSGLSIVIQYGFAFEFRNRMRLDISFVTSAFNALFMPVVNIRFQ